MRGEVQGIPPGLRQRLAAQQFGENRFGERSLETEHRQVLGAVLHHHILEAGPQRLQMTPVLFPVGGIDHQEIGIFEKAVEIGVIHRTPLGVGQQGVLALARFQCGRVVGQSVLQKPEAFPAGNDKPAHMRDIEQTGPAPGGQVLLQDAAGILNGHRPAPEFDHLGFECDMMLIKYRF